MKLHQRLDYDRLAEVLGERGLVEPSALQHVMHQCMSTGQLPPEVLVTENLISDWELARVACETFSLPFLPVDIYTPSLNATTELDVSFLHRHALVPLDRFGKQLTVAMPILVPAKILTGLEREHGIEVIPVIGCVASNRRWLQQNLTLQAQLSADEAVDGALPGESEDPWAGIFDAGDAAVLLELEGGDEGEDVGLTVDGLDDLEGLDDLGLGDLSDAEGEIPGVDLEGSPDPPSILPPPSVDDEPSPAPVSRKDDEGEDGPSLDLPKID